MRVQRLLLAGTVAGAGAQSECPGYRASNVQQSDQGLTATLQLAGDPCNVYGPDVHNLALTVEYQTGKTWSR